VTRASLLVIAGLSVSALFGLASGASAQSAGAPASFEDAAAQEQAAAPAKAPAKKKVAKPKKKAPKEKTVGNPGPGQVLVVNQRAVRLRQLTLTSTTAPDKSGIVAKDLAPGAKAIGKVPPKAGCDFSASGEFDDGTTLEIEAVSVCKDRTLNLVE